MYVQQVTCVGLLALQHEQIKYLFLVFHEAKNKKLNVLSYAVDVVGCNLFAARAFYHTIHRAHRLCL